MSDTETIRVTYVELAQARGITVAAARRLTQRHKWPKQIGNDGFTHVVVPTSMLAAWDGDTYDDSRVKSNGDAYDDAGVNGNVSSRLKGSDACNGLDVDIRVKEGLKNSEICDDTDVGSRTIPADVYDDTTRPRKSAVDPATVRAIADATADV